MFFKTFGLGKISPPPLPVACIGRARGTWPSPPKRNLLSKIAFWSNFKNFLNKNEVFYFVPPQTKSCSATALDYTVFRNSYFSFIK